MSAGKPDYPWLVYGPDGEVQLGAIPERLLRHPEVQRRGFTLTDTLKPGVIYSTFRPRNPAFAVKILDPTTEELAIYQRLRHEVKRSNNHTIPFDIALQDHPLLIMPLVGNLEHIYPLNLSLRVLVDVSLQIVEGIDFLHSLHIVHLDMCEGNVVAAIPQHAAVHEQVIANRVYVIDYDSSRQLTLGPGVQQAIVLPETQVTPPNHMQCFDPYSWDVYCVGRTLETFVQERFCDTNKHPHWIILKYIQWLIGDERGCTCVCNCRPTARTALRVVVLLQWAVYATEGYRWVVDTLARLWSTPRRA